MSLLDIKGLSIYYHTDDGLVKAVNDVDLHIAQGETLGLVGETGAGKTTTALGIMGLVPNPPGKIETGEILYKGENLLDKNDRQMRHIRGREISMIFQDPMTALNPLHPVVKQIAEVIRHHSDCNRMQAERKAMEMLEKVGISAERATDYPHQFSGGMKQRVVIAIALACNPNLLIADEPTTALDVTIQAQVLDMMNDLKKENHTAMLLITHDLGVVAEVCDKVAIMYAGEIVEYGTLEDVFEHTAHPYTKGLFDSIPRMDIKVDVLKPIKGLMPDPANLPNGCKFHPRCPNAISHCAEVCPVLMDIGNGHMARCLHYAAEGDLSV